MKIYIVVMDVVNDVTYSHNRQPPWPSAALATSETNQVLLAGVPGLLFAGFSGFRPTF